MIDPIIKTVKKLWPAYQILFFYFIIVIVTSTLGYLYDKQHGFDDGHYIGIIISLFLWNKYGRSMASI